MQVQLFFLLVVPAMIIISCSVKIFFAVKKLREVKREGAIAILLVAAVYCIVSVPMGVLYFFNLHNLMVFRQIAYFVVFLNSAGNCIIYYFSISSFKLFIKRKLTKSKMPKSTTFDSDNLRSFSVHSSHGKTAK